METYLRITFDSEGGKPSEVADRLLQAGFVPTHGNYDFVYEWRGNAPRDDVLELADALSEQLRGFRVLFEIETV